MVTVTLFYTADEEQVAVEPLSVDELKTIVNGVEDVSE